MVVPPTQFLTVTVQVHRELVSKLYILYSNIYLGMKKFTPLQQNSDENFEQKLFLFLLIRDSRLLFCLLPLFCAQSQTYEKLYHLKYT